MNDYERRLMELAPPTAEDVAQALYARHEWLRRLLRHDLGEDRVLVEHACISLFLEAARVRDTGITMMGSIDA